MTSLRWITPEHGGEAPRPTARLLGRVAHTERVGSMYLLRLRVPGWRPARPGQFAMVQPVDSTCFLPRAFSVHDERPPAERPTATEGDTYEVSFLIAPVGAATEELSLLELGDSLYVTGPLGRGFDPVALSGGGRVVIVAGGVGAAPFGLLLRRLAELESPPARILLLLGFRDEVQAEAHHLFTEPVRLCREAGVAVETELITEDGHLGRRGLVTDLLPRELAAGDRLAVCGAHAMCAAVWDLCLECRAGSRDVAAWFSLEAGMACGFGSCQGCVIETADGSLAKVCRRGPVFSGEEAFGAAGHACGTGEEGVGYPAGDGGADE